MKIVGVSGKIGSGKSTLCHILYENLIAYSIPVEIVAFADKLRDIVEILTGYRGTTQEEKNIIVKEYDMSVGEILQIVGTKALRNNFDKDVWIKSLFSSMHANTVYLIQDVRFENEANAIKKKNGILVRLEGDPMNIRLNSKRNLTHSSETSLDNYDKFDFIYHNDNKIDNLVNFSESVLNAIVN